MNPLHSSRRDRSIEFVNVLSAVSRVADQGAAWHVDHQVQVFKRQLADQHGDRAGTSITSIVQDLPMIVRRTA